VTKSQEYAAIETVRRYSVLAQESMAGTMFERIEGVELPEAEWQTS
jgi:hypothetical protein